MKNLVIFLFVLTLSANISVSYSWDSTAAKYMPLKVGNMWIYKTEIWSYAWFCYAYEKYMITDTNRINGRLFYNVMKTHSVFYPICNQQQFPVASRLFQFSTIRIDSSNMNLYSLNNCVIDSLRASKNDSIKVCPNYYEPVICDTNSVMIFGSNRTAKNFIFQWVESSELMQYVKGIGLNKYICLQPGPSGRNMILQGCVINGVLYGDTNTLVGINNISSEVPEQFSLSQNYPNPFNPVTKIRFSIPNAVILSGAKNPDIKLVIYDALGSEIQTLVNQSLSPGTYEVDWDASAYPSGVYYYMIKAGDPSTSSGQVFKETKKMVLMK